MKDIEAGIEDDTHLEEDYAKMPVRSRILFAEDGIEKIANIDETLNLYKGLSAKELVTITHVVGGPWDSVEKDVMYAEISDTVIYERHFKEVELLNEYRQNRFGS